MNGFRTTVRRALNLARRLTPAPRAIPMLGLASALAFSTLGPPAPVGATAPMPEDRDLAVRVQVVVKEVYIWDDRDPGDGEMRLHFGLACFAKPSPCLGLPNAALDSYTSNLSGGSGDTVTLNLALPRSRENMSPSYDASVDAGYPLYVGQSYELKFEMWEGDLLSGEDFMGERQIVLRPENGWGIGTHRLRSTREGVSGDFEIEFEIRPAPLPDIRPVNMKVHDLAGGTKKLVCMAVVNSGSFDAGPFDVALRVDGVVPPGGRATAGGLASGDWREQCVEVALPTSGQHTLVVVVDEPRTLAEYIETNNVYEQPYQR